MKFRNLQILQNFKLWLQIAFFKFLLKFFIYFLDINSSKNNSALGRSSYVVSKKVSLTYAFVIF